MYNFLKIKWLVFLKIYLKEINLKWKILMMRNISIANMRNILLQEFYIYFIFEEYFLAISK